MDRKHVLRFFIYFLSQKNEGDDTHASEVEPAKSVSDDKPTIPTPKGTTPEPPAGTPTVTEPTTADKEEEDTHPSELKEETEKTEGEGGGEGKKQEDDSSKMHVLCHDDNIRTKSLENIPVDQVLVATTLRVSLQYIWL